MRLAWLASGVAACLLLLGAPGAGAQQERTITGRVVREATGEPLAGAQVTVRGTRTGGVARPDGTFSVPAPAGPVTLVVEYIGYRGREVVVPAGEGVVEVRLATDVLQLDEVVVTGRATGVKRRNLANAVASVGADELVRAPTASVEQALQGKVAGAVIRTNSGAPGGGVTVQLRGLTSIIGTFTPLYVVDGVIVSDAAILPGLNSVTNATGTDALTSPSDNPVNRIADINPDDIESVEVLKGASAAAIYGSKAAAGVVVITTKRGSAGAAAFTVRQELGVSTLARKVGFRRFETLEEARGVFGPAADAHFQPGRFFDHEEALAGREPLSHETSASVRGGTGDTRYFGSLLARHEGGIIPGTFADKQALRLNLDKSIGGRVTLALGSQIVRSRSDRGLTQNDNNGTSYYGALAGTPSFIDLRPGAGGDFPLNPFSGSNPLQTAALLRNEETVWRLIGTGGLTIEALRGDRHALRLVVNSGADFFQQKNNVFSPPELQFEPADGLPGTVVLSQASNVNVNVGASVVHELRPRSGAFTATTSAGAQYEYHDLDVTRMLGRNLVGGLRKVNAGTALTGTEELTRVKDLGFYVQEEVLVRDRLLLTAGIRGDQSSSNAEDDRIFFYPKAAASYRLPAALGPVDEVKLRLAYGQSGNQPRFGQKFSVLTPANISGIPTFVIQGVTAAPDLHPERQQELEGGADLTLFGERMRLEATGYQKTISDLMLQRALPPSSGFTALVRNEGKLRIRGVEASLSGVLRAGDLGWEPRLNFARARCTVTSLPGGEFRPGGFGASFGERRMREGESCTQVIGNDTLADGTSQVRKIGDDAPSFTLGLANGVSWRRFDAYLLLDWEKGASLLNISQWLLDAFANSEDYLVGRDGEPSGEQRFARWAKSARVYYQDASFLKLREASLSYTVPPALLRRVWGQIRQLQVSVQGRNLFTITPYQDGDPEVSQYPTFATIGRWDLWAYPPSRSVWLSVNASF